MYNCIIIVGPTASGKTTLSVNLALKLGGEIINADSQQIYKKLNIGTAKITTDESKGVKHHLLDCVEIGEEFSVAEYKKLAMPIITKLIKSKKVPIIVGGTGLYVDSLLYEMDYGYTNKNNERREELYKLAQDNGNEYVYNILRNLDIATANKLHQNDLKRVIRAIEIGESGKLKSSQQKIQNSLLKPLIVGLNYDREILYNNINLRVDLMIQNNLFKEIENLYKMGYYDTKITLPIGYSEWYDYYNNNLPKEEVVQNIKQHTRNYAKRQITWFKGLDAVWFDSVHNTMQNIVDDILKLYNK